MRAAGRIVGNGLAAVWAEARRSLWRRGRDAVDLLDDDEYREGDDQELEHGIEKSAIGDDRYVCGLCLLQCMDGLRAKVDEKVREVDAA